MAALVLHGNCRRLFNVGGKMASRSALVAASSPECRPSGRLLRVPPRGGRRGLLCLFLCAGTFLFSVAVFAQQRSAGAMAVPPSDLASDNQERVAASEAQIVAVLNSDTGLLVELKRWVAKDAADHGQVVEDEDLADSAIFLRLSRDPKFRAVATRILQRYGYLVPKLNPDSDMGQEHDLLVKERVRLLAAQQERDQSNVATASANGAAARANSRVYRCRLPGTRRAKSDGRIRARDRCRILRTTRPISPLGTIRAGLPVPRIRPGTRKSQTARWSIWRRRVRKAIATTAV